MLPDASRNIILVGPARSGTTLACSLLNDPEVANTVALDEPWEREQIAALEATDFLSFVEQQFDQFRRMILEQGEAVTTAGDHGLCNHYDLSPSGNALRERVVSCGTTKVEKHVDPDVSLVIKHTIPFTGMLDQLEDHYPTYAIVRNPLAILASWNTIDATYRDGRPPPYARHLCGDMPWLIGAVRDRIERQVVLLSWHFELYLPLLRMGQVVRYEDIIDSRGSALGTMTPQAQCLSNTLNNHNVNALYPAELIQDINVALHRVGGPIWNFYGRQEVDGLTDLLLGSGLIDYNQ